MLVQPPLRVRRQGKDVAPVGKKSKKGDAGRKDPLVLIIDGQSASDPPVMVVMAPAHPPSAQQGEGDLSREDIQFSLIKGTAIVHGTVDPKEFLRGATPSLDKASLSRLEDDALDNKILRSSLTACIALSKQVRRAEQLRLQKAEQDETLRRLVHDNADAARQMARLEESPRQAEQKLEAAKVETRAEGRAEAEKAAAEAAKKAADEAEAVKEVAIAKAQEEAVAAFVAEGWKAEGYNQWLSSAVGASVDEWCEGPDVEWLARKGKEYYDGGEFFTHALIYRRMARHLKIEPKDFDPAAYGLPPLQPDVRVPLPPDVERPDLEDSMLMAEAEDDQVGTEGDVTSKPVEEGADEVADI
ncbi:unnamed protein product [Cuscuta europaea]|uniref:Uncharacterized protein n=1 Tax=Cuscuta europaea TaxID=41803 RepID=A0A9P1E0X8_CUSEU|nr:unnamed protein product [Cuscuta europaea]